MGLMNTLLIPLGLMYCLISVQCIRRPVIGILMQKSSSIDPVTGYRIFGNYVKALEGSGAYVVPVLINEDISYYREILTKVNGILLPGGSADLMDPTDIGAAGATIYKLAEELNDDGVYFPILGVCQGFQLLAMASAGMQPLLSPCKGLLNLGMSLKFVTKPSESYLYRNAPKEVIRILKNEPVTANVHSFCVTPKTLENFNLTSTWRVLTVDRDEDGLQFISSMEHTRYPFVGVQFHPEKNIYSLNEKFTFPTDHNAIVASRWFYDWFVEDSKKNTLASLSNSTCVDNLMEKFCPSLVSNHWSLTQKYFFGIHDSRIAKETPNTCGE